MAVPPPWEMKEPELRDFDRVPPRLSVCYGCLQYVHAGTETCPHCGVNVPQYTRQQRELEEAIATLRHAVTEA